MKILTLLILTLTLASCEYVKYDYYKVYRILPKTVEQEQILKEIEDTNKFDFWTGIGKKDPVDIMVAPEYFENFEKLMTGYHFKYNILIENVQSIIHQTRLDDPTRVMGWDDYRTIDEIDDWLDSLPGTYDGVTVVDAGITYNNRTIKGVKLTLGSPSAPVAFIEAGIHGREWIAPATATYIINEFLTSADPRVIAVAQSFVWYIIPSFNPDGYEYTISDDRMWIKNVQPNSGTVCSGTNLNRNFAYMRLNGGGSIEPCSEWYAGKRINSAPETFSLSEFINGTASNMKLFVSFHSYGQKLMFPYGYTWEHLDNYGEHYDIAAKAVEALKTLYGTEYTIGSIGEIDRTGGGTCEDWVKSKGTRFVFFYELRDLGTYGYLLPSDQIIPTAEEALASLVVIAEEVLQAPDKNQ